MAVTQLVDVGVRIYKEAAECILTVEQMGLGVLILTSDLCSCSAFSEPQFPDLSDDANLSQGFYNLQI